MEFKALSQTVSVIPMLIFEYWHADNPVELDLEPAGDGGIEYVLANPEECCLALSRNVAILDVQVSEAAAAAAALRWWYIEYGLAVVEYGHDGVPVFVDIPPDNILPVLILAATEDADVLKQFIEFWWWFVETTEPNGLTGHGNVLVPNGDGTFAQLL